MLLGGPGCICAHVQRKRVENCILNLRYEVGCFFFASSPGLILSDNESNRSRTCTTEDQRLLCGRFKVREMHL